MSFKIKNNNKKQTIVSVITALEAGKKMMFYNPRNKPRCSVICHQAGQDSQYLSSSSIYRCSVFPEDRFASEWHHLAPDCVYSFGGRNILDYSCLCVHSCVWIYVHLYVQVEDKGLGFLFIIFNLFIIGVEEKSQHTPIFFLFISHGNRTFSWAHGLSE